MLYVSEEVMDRHGLTMDGEGNLEQSEKKERVISVEDLERMMEEAVASEEYQLAAEYRDKIKEIKGE